MLAQHLTQIRQFESRETDRPQEMQGVPNDTPPSLLRWLDSRGQRKLAESGAHPLAIMEIATRFAGDDGLPAELYYDWARILFESELILIQSKLAFLRQARRQALSERAVRSVIDLKQEGVGSLQALEGRLVREKTLVQKAMGALHSEPPPSWA